MTQNSALSRGKSGFLPTQSATQTRSESLDQNPAGESATIVILGLAAEGEAPFPGSTAHSTRREEREGKRLPPLIEHKVLSRTYS